MQGFMKLFSIKYLESSGNNNGEKKPFVIILIYIHKWLYLENSPAGFLLAAAKTISSKLFRRHAYILSNVISITTVWFFKRANG